MVSVRSLRRHPQIDADCADYQATELDQVEKEPAEIGVICGRFVYPAFTKDAAKFAPTVIQAIRDSRIAIW
jgi:hypothetical protein